MRSAGKTDIGLVRKVNEDSFLCEQLVGIDNTYLYIVADGRRGSKFHGSTGGSFIYKKEY